MYTNTHHSVLPVVWCAKTPREYTIAIYKPSASATRESPTTPKKSREQAKQTSTFDMKEQEHIAKGKIKLLFLLFFIFVYRH
jgi:hypothetical protein